MKLVPHHRQRRSAHHRALWMVAAALLGAFCPPAYADDAVLGATLSAGPVIASDSGYFVDASLYGGLALWLFLGAEAKQLNGRSHNAVSAGAGVGPFVQLQAGWSNQGPLYRLKSEFSPFALLRGRLISYRDGLASLNRWSLSVIYENGFARRELESLSLGIGYTFY